MFTLPYYAIRCFDTIRDIIPHRHRERLYLYVYHYIISLLPPLRHITLRRRRRYDDAITPLFRAATMPLSLILR